MNILLQAKSFEDTLGLAVIQHGSKKPAPSCAEEVTSHLQAEPHEVVMIGDRYLTDVVFGNLFGMLTIRTEFFEASKDPIVVQYARMIEKWLLKAARNKGILPPEHPLAYGRILSSVIQPKLGSTSDSGSISFGDKAYWESFYNAHRVRSSIPGKKNFEWFVDSGASADLIDDALKPNSGILHLGAGMSNLGPLLQVKGHSVVNVDYDRCAVAVMQESDPSGEWHVYDAKSLPQKWGGRFEAIVDKGCLDAMIFQGKDEVSAYLMEAIRLLKDDGKMIFITDDPPEQRMELLKEALGGEFRVTWRPLDGAEVGDATWSYFIYTAERSA